MVNQTGQLNGASGSLLGKETGERITEEDRYIGICMPWFHILFSSYSLARQGETAQLKSMQKRLMRILIKANAHEEIPYNLRGVHMQLTRCFAALIQTLRTNNSQNGTREAQFRKTAESVSELGRMVERLRDWQVITPVQYSNLIMPSSTSDDPKQSWPAFLYSGQPPAKRA